MKQVISRIGPRSRAPKEIVDWLRAARGSPAFTGKNAHHLYLVRVFGSGRALVPAPGQRGWGADPANRCLHP